MSKQSFKILVAEDELFQRLALFDLLEMCGYDVVAAEDGTKAMAELRNQENDFDLILLDLYMPEMDGFEVLNLIMGDPRLKLIPVVVMSSTESNDIISDCLKKGALNFLVKPIRLQQCRSLVGFMKAYNNVALANMQSEEKGLSRF